MCFCECESVNVNPAALRAYSEEIFLNLPQDFYREHMTLNEIFERRVSIRKFDASKRIPHETLVEIISAASLAPSWKNSQTARYYVAESQEKINEILAAFPQRNASNASGASALVVTAYVKDVAGYSREGNPDNELGNGWGIYDSGISNAYVVLKSAELGVDSLIMGIRDAEAIRKAFDIPDNQDVLSVIALGYRTSEPSRPQRKPLEEICIFE